MLGMEPGQDSLFPSAAQPPRPTRPRRQAHSLSEKNKNKNNQKMNKEHFSILYYFYPVGPGPLAY